VILSAEISPSFDHPYHYSKITAMRPAIAYLHLDHLIHNYRLLQQRAHKASVMAVVKADAYGHGLEHIAPALAAEGCQSFAVTDAEEGTKLRQLIQTGASITLLSGLFDANDASLAQASELTPVVTEQRHLQWLLEAGFEGEVWLKINTGMQRLGADNPQQLIATCHELNIPLAGIMSHLACADSPEHPLNRVQADSFSSLHQTLAPQLPASLLNSAGLIALPEFQYDVIRPGIALYGAEPVALEPMGLKPVMEFTGEIMQIREVQEATTLSYGASFIAERDMHVALVCVGYGDGLPRALSNRGAASFEGQRLPIVGRICMDYCLLDCSNSSLAVGDTVSFWGHDISPNEVAESIDTIPYTLMTGVNKRVHRIPIPSSGHQSNGHQ